MYCCACIYLFKCTYVLQTRISVYPFLFGKAHVHLTCHQANHRAACCCTALDAVGDTQPADVYFLIGWSKDWPFSTVYDAISLTVFPLGCWWYRLLTMCEIPHVSIKHRKLIAVTPSGIDSLLFRWIEPLRQILISSIISKYFKHVILDELQETNWNVYLGGAFQDCWFSPLLAGKWSSLTILFFPEGWFNHQRQHSACCAKASLGKSGMLPTWCLTIATISPTAGDQGWSTCHVLWHRSWRKFTPWNLKKPIAWKKKKHRHSSAIFGVPAVNFCPCFFKMPQCLDEFSSFTQIDKLGIFRRWSGEQVWNMRAYVRHHIYW